VEGEAQMLGSLVGLPTPVAKVFDEVLHRAVSEVLKERHQAAADALAKKMARGKPWLISENDAAAALLSILRAAEEGVARRNLDLMAEALANQAAEEVFHPDVFRSQAAMLADLSVEEIFILAAFIRVRQREAAEELEGVRKSKEWVEVNELLLAKKALFKSSYDVTAHTSGLLRTGLVIPWSGWDAFTGFSSTPRLDALSCVVDFEAASAD
jgi:hypothetical protein